MPTPTPSPHRTVPLFSRAQATPSLFPAPLSHVMYTQEEEGLIVGDDPSNKGEDDPNPISVKGIQVASTQTALHTDLHALCLPSIL